MCIRGLGASTKTGSVLLTAATSGGAVVPAIMSPVTESRGVQYGLSVVVAFFAFGALLPIYTEIVPAAKAQVDPVRGNDTESTRVRFIRAGQMFRRKEMSDLPRTEEAQGQPQ